MKSKGRMWQTEKKNQTELFHKEISNQNKTYKSRKHIKILKIIIRKLRFENFWMERFKELLTEQADQAANERISEEDIRMENEVEKSTEEDVEDIMYSSGYRKAQELTV